MKRLLIVVFLWLDRFANRLLGGAPMTTISGRIGWYMVTGERYNLLWRALSALLEALFRPTEILSGEISANETRTHVQRAVIVDALAGGAHKPIGQGLLGVLQAAALTVACILVAWIGCIPAFAAATINIFRR